jgi:hypothetical protein
MEIFSENKQIGDYIVLQCLKETQETRTWSAKQVSVGRAVLIDELKQAYAGNSQSFLADVRAKAAVEHPLVGSIYEASTDHGHCFYAYELLPGDTVAQLVQSQKKFKAQRICHLLRRIAEANIYHESHKNSTSPLGPDDIHIDSQGIIRLENLVMHGERAQDQSLRDIIRLGSFFQALIDPNHPGTTRCLTLLAWMRGEDTEHYLTWAQIRDYCEQIEQQLTEPSEIQVLPTAAIPIQPKSSLLWVWLTLAVLLVGGAIAFSISRKNTATRIQEAKLAWIEIPTGSYSTLNGFDFSIVDFSISSQEVSIGEYAKFLKTLDLLSKESNDHVFNHPEQPKEKTNHKPTHWDDLLEAANKSKPWNNININLNSPVVGVDWWDAYAYAKWKKCVLPTQEQWLAALVCKTKEYSTIPVSAWPPTGATPDRTTNGIIAMAGSVAEWTAEPRVTPSNPLGKPQWVIMGGSYLKPGKGSLSMEWTDNRSTRRPDLGFRICQSN